MIITVTLNAAIDKTLAVPNFRLGRRHPFWARWVNWTRYSGRQVSADKIHCCRPMTHSGCRM